MKNSQCFMITVWDWELQVHLNNLISIIGFTLYKSRGNGIPRTFMLDHVKIYIPVMKFVIDISTSMFELKQFRGFSLV